MKKSLNQLQMEFLKKHVHDHEENNGALTEAFTFDGDPGMILYTLVSSNKIVKGAVFI